jgi:hypothetical protein
MAIRRLGALRKYVGLRRRLYRVEGLGSDTQKGGPSLGSFFRKPHAHRKPHQEPGAGSRMLPSTDASPPKAAKPATERQDIRVESAAGVRIVRSFGLP